MPTIAGTLGNDAFVLVTTTSVERQVDGNTYLTGDTNGDGLTYFMIGFDGLQILESGDLLL